MKWVHLAGGRVGIRFAMFAAERLSQPPLCCHNCWPRLALRILKGFLRVVHLSPLPHAGMQKQQRALAYTQIAEATDRSRMLVRISCGRMADAAKRLVDGARNDAAELRLTRHARTRGRGRKVCACSED